MALDQRRDEPVHISLVIAMIVVCVRMVGRPDQVPVAAIHAAGIAIEDILNDVKFEPGNPPLSERYTQSQVVVRKDRAGFILSELARLGREELVPPVTWLLNHENPIKFYFEPAGNLQARDIPVLLVANNADLKKADIKKIQAAFPQYQVVGISAKFGDNIDAFYEAIFALAY